MYPSKEGGCEMYVTKLGFSMPEKEKNIMDTVEPQVYRFETLGILMRVCVELSRLGYSRFGRTYTDKNGFFLYLESDAVQKNAARTAFLSEFGEKWDGDVFFRYKGEYCSPICESGAIGVLSELN
jgi:hypothetical protein